jgi:hypothetical protein
MLANVFVNFTAKINEAIQNKTNINNKNNKNHANNSESVFKLPIEYLDHSDRFVLNATVCDDLELSVKESIVDISNNDIENENTMYHYLLKPTNDFALNTIPKWNKYITANTVFLEETQEIIQTIGPYKKNMETMNYTPDYDTIMKIWHDTKEDPNFLERYSYIEFEMFKNVNKMPAFLQAISVVNMGSPILSFLVPFILFLFPFVIVKMQGIPITFSVYIRVLKDISKNHFIGKLIANMQDMSLQNFVYIIILLGLYAYQIYQNYMACMRFYKNISRINEQICEMQKYLNYSISNMEYFSLLLKNKTNYYLFQQDLQLHINNLKDLRTYIQSVRPFKPSFSKIGEIGTLLGCYYELYSNTEYEISLKYSFDFEGFSNNLLGIFENLEKNKIGVSDFYTNMDISGNPLIMKEQYYPALINDTYVVNDADIDKNMIITGPNAAGKTTFLKTTLINIIFTQQFGCGFYSSCKMKPYTHIHSYLNIPDTSGRDSLFQAESRRCKEILNVIVNDTIPNSRHFSIFDELYSGTNPLEASKSAYAFLLYLSKFDNVDFILTTHYVDICSRLTSVSNKIENWKMDASINEQGDIQYMYKISKGISTIQGAIKVLRDMEYPDEIIQTMTEYDKESVRENKLETKEIKRKKKENKKRE